ncbi:MAG: M28 family peptidase [Clostridia bacterium]|nr:M28 family peptidase [Clostridia bacterium]
MAKSAKITSILLAIVLCFMFVVSIVDTNETRKDTNFNQENMLTHIEKLSENGPRSIIDKEANEKALAYIVSQVESWGVKEGDTTEAPAYMIQDYVAIDENGKYQNFYLKNVIVHIPANAENTTGEAVMFMGHFDSVPMGQGSSDDGVACATMLEAIRYYLDKMENGYTLTNDLVFCFVNGEEYNLFSSRAFMDEFKGFDNIVNRIKFGTNLESRGTDGTLIMFETAANNYKTVQLFSEINKNAFTCSIATMVYDMMPNGTDFSNFKEAYQGLNMANIGGGENYHTQNDAPENVGMTYLSQQAQIVDAIIEKLGSYDLDQLYDADESAIFFSYFNLTTVVYNHTATIVLAIIAIILLVLNIVLSATYRKQNNVGKTAKATLAVIVGLVLSAGVTYLFYYLFQLIAALFGVIDIHMIGTITYSNVAIVIGIGLTALAVSVLTTHFATKWLKIERKDLTRTFAYVHAVLGIVLSFVLADASYLFIFSGILLLVNELMITLIKKTDFSDYHGELLATALYFPIVIPVIFLATSALGMTMAYVYGLVFALALFAVGVCITPLCERFSIRWVVKAIKKKDSKVSAAEGALHILMCAMIILFVVSVIKPNASVNLQGKQNIAKLPYDDALVYVSDTDGDYEYRVYDLNAYGALQEYAPEMKYSGECYVGKGEKQNIKLKAIATADNGVLTVKKNVEDSLVYLDFKNINAESFTVDDGITTRTYNFEDKDTYSIKLHSECTLTVNGGNADVEYKEVLRDYAELIPAEYANDSEKLHFNLWLTAEFQLGK